jgi:hypothetical protein
MRTSSRPKSGSLIAGSSAACDGLSVVYGRIAPGDHPSPVLIFAPESSFAGLVGSSPIRGDAVKLYIRFYTQ